MKDKRYENILPFIWDNILQLIFSLLVFTFVLWTRFQFLFLNIFFLIASIYDIWSIIKLYNIIHDVKNNNFITEYMFVSIIKEGKFDALLSKRYFVLQCHKVQENKYTNEIVCLKSSKDIEFKEKSYAKVTYYKNSKLINSFIL